MGPPRRTGRPRPPPRRRWPCCRRCRARTNRPRRRSQWSTRRPDGGGRRLIPKKRSEICCEQRQDCTFAPTAAAAAASTAGPRLFIAFAFCGSRSHPSTHVKPAQMQTTCGRKAAVVQRYRRRGGRSCLGGTRQVSRNSLGGVSEASLHLRVDSLHQIDRQLRLHRRLRAHTQRGQHPSTNLSQPRWIRSRPISARPRPPSPPRSASLSLLSAPLGECCLREVEMDHPLGGRRRVGAYAVARAKGLDQRAAHLPRASDDQHAATRRVAAQLGPGVAHQSEGMTYNEYS